MALMASSAAAVTSGLLAQLATVGQVLGVDRWTSAATSAIEAMLSDPSLTGVAVSGLLAYHTFVRAAVNQRREALRPIIRAGLDGSGSLWRAWFLLTSNEYPSEYILSLNFRGILITYGVPTISAVLEKTGGFQRDVQRRYADMELLITEFTEQALDGTEEGQPQRAKTAVQRMNAIHNKYGNLILYRDMLYVLSVFAVTPVTWACASWSAQCMTDDERELAFRFWQLVGKEMNLLLHDEWSCYADAERFKLEYETKYMRFARSNKVVADATISYFMRTLPSFLVGPATAFTHQLISELQESDLQRRALGLPPSIPWFNRCIYGALAFYSYFCRNWVMPYPIGGGTRTSDQNDYNPADTPFCAKLFYPKKPMRFGNRLYTPFSAWFGTGRGYIIENLGPSEVPKGELCPFPHFRM